MVRAGVPEIEAARFSSHSLKATLLNWSALHGSLSMDEHRAMGHHFDSRLAVPLVYSRDYLCNIHCKLQRMFQDIRAGVFDPQETRAQRIARGTASQPVPDFGCGSPSQRYGGAIVWQIMVKKLWTPAL